MGGRRRILFCPEFLLWEKCVGVATLFVATVFTIATPFACFAAPRRMPCVYIHEIPRAERASSSNCKS